MNSVPGGTPPEEPKITFFDEGNELPKAINVGQWRKAGLFTLVMLLLLALWIAGWQYYRWSQLSGFSARCLESGGTVDREGGLECLYPASSSSPAPSDLPPVGSAISSCVTSGCSGELCVASDEAGGVASICEWKEAYACYKEALCERQMDGGCGWTLTPEYEACLRDIQ